MDSVSSVLKVCLISSVVIALPGCGQKSVPSASSNAQGHSQVPSIIDSRYSKFGDYEALPAWSGWCPVSTNPDECEKRLRGAVEHQTSKSRGVVRNHGWGLWAGIATPIENSGYDRQTNSSTMFGTTDCWLKRSDGTACSGVFPIWLTWPNTGVPYVSASSVADNNNNLIAVNRAFTEGAQTNVSATMAQDDATLDEPLYVNPTLKSTVNTTTANPPAYQLPALAVTKNCGIPQKHAQKLIDAAEASGDWQPLQSACEYEGHYGVVCADNAGFCDGNAFVNQGDVMIATESLSVETWDAIQNNGLYNGGDTLDTIYNENSQKKAATKVASWLPSEYVSTKHMFWPVKGCNPNVVQGKEGCRIRYGALPPWVPSKFKEYNYATNSRYLGYETWGEVVAIDTCGNACKPKDHATLALAHVKHAHPITTRHPKVFAANDFVHLQVSAETLAKAFTTTDRALLDQAMIWAYGDESNGFEAGDFLVVAAMHITTKEVDTWAFNSVWWSPMDDTLSECQLDNVKGCFGQSPAYGAQSQYSGLSSADIKRLDSKAGQWWRRNYLLTDSYGIRYEINGKETSVSNYFNKPPRWSKERPDGSLVEQLPVSMNVYIEPVIHPIGTNCQNCHRRAGIVSGSAKSRFAVGVGKTNYQTAQCPSLLADYGQAGQDPCMTEPWVNHIGGWLSKSGKNHCNKDTPEGVKCDGDNAYPIVNTDTSWFIADRHIQKAKN